MSERVSEPTTPSEGFVLARRGLPLAGGVPSQPRAAWLPAPARSPIVAMPPRVLVLPEVADEEEEPKQDGEAEGWDLPRPAPVTRGVDAASGGERVSGDVDERDTQAVSASTNERATGTPAASEPAAPHSAETGLADFPTTALHPSQVAERSPSSARSDRPHATQRGGTLPDAHSMRAASMHSDDGTGSSARPLPATSAANATPAAASPAQPACAHGADSRASHGDLQRLASVTVIAAPQAGEPAAFEPSDIEPVAITDTRPVRTETPAAPATPAVHAAAQSLPLMGLPAARSQPAASASTAAADIDVLMAPTPAPMRSVHIDRVSVTVQATAAPPAPSGQATPAAPTARSARAPAPAAFRNPWASYHARRD